MIKNITILKTFKSSQDTCPKPSQGCNLKDYDVPGKKDDHLISIWNDNPKACFKNAIEKKAFTWAQVAADDYIMYMCSDDKFDHFKSKLTKTKWTVKRADVYAQSDYNGGSYVNV